MWRIRKTQEILSFFWLNAYCFGGVEPRPLSFLHWQTDPIPDTSEMNLHRVQDWRCRCSADITHSLTFWRQTWKYYIKLLLPFPFINENSSVNVERLTCIFILTTANSLLLIKRKGYNISLESVRWVLVQFWVYIIDPGVITKSCWCCFPLWISTP